MYIQREMYTDKVYNALKHTPIVVLIGARQVGKTSIIENLTLQKTNIILNGQDVNIAELFQNYANIEKYLRNNINDNLDGYLLIDEFQYISGISVMLKLLTDSYDKLRIICTGSSSLDVLQKVEESLAGRVRVIEVYSLSFKEYLRFSNNSLYEKFLKYDIDTNDIIADKRIGLELKEYYLYGGFPRVAIADNPNDKILILNDIYRTYLLKDIRSYVKNKHSVGFNKLLRLLSAQIGNLLNVNNLANNSGLPYRDCEEYIYLLEQMYIIKLIEPYGNNKRKEITKMKKLYFMDIGLRNVVYNSFNDIDIRVDNGNIFENHVFLEIVKNIELPSGVNFYRTKDGVEVDFVISTPLKTTTIEAKCKNYEQAVYIKSLNNFNESENIDYSYVANQNLNAVKNDVRFLQAYLLDKIVF